MANRRSVCRVGQDARERPCQFPPELLAWTVTSGMPGKARSVMILLSCFCAPRLLGAVLWRQL